MDTLIKLGQALGLSGAVVGVFFLLFKDVIRKNIFPMLDNDRAYKLLRTIIILVFIFSSLIATIATLAQLVISGYAPNLNLNVHHGNDTIDFAITFDQFNYVTQSQAAAAKPSDAKLVRKGSGNMQEQFDIYNRAADIVSKKLSALSRRAPYRKFLSKEILERTAAQSRRGEIGALNQLFKELVDLQSSDVGSAKQDMIELGYNIARMQEAKMDFDGSVEAYKVVLQLDPKDIKVIYALSYLYLERGEWGNANALLDHVLASISGAPEENSIFMSQLLTIRSDVLMWGAKFDDALASLRKASEIAEQSAMISDDARRAEVERLNSAAGLFQDMGNMSDALSSVRQALVLNQQVGDSRTELNLKMNEGVILVDCGEISAAVKVVESLRDKIAMLPQQDIFRGYFLILSAYTYMKEMNTISADINLKGAQDVFRAIINGGEFMIRNARAACIEQTIKYFKGDNEGSSVAGISCVTATKHSSPGRVADLINSYYLSQKGALKKGIPIQHFRSGEWGLVPLPPNYNSYVELIEKVLDSAQMLRGAKKPKKAAIRKNIEQAIVGLAALENRTGMTLDALTDAVLLKNEGSLSGDITLTIEKLNEFRKSIGAKNIR